MEFIEKKYIQECDEDISDLNLLELVVLRESIKIELYEIDTAITLQIQEN